MLRAQVGAAGDEMPNRTAKAFAPFIRAVVTRRMNAAQQIFKTSRAVQNYLELPESVAILARFQKPDRLDLNLIGGRTLGQNLGILYFTVSTEDGPVAFKVFFYGFNNEIFIDQIEMTDDWTEMSDACINLQMLQSPVTVPLGNKDDGGGQ